MRTIDGDALSAFVGDLRSTLHKEQSTFKAMTEIEFNTRDYMLLNFQYTIDNAPTVEPCANCEDRLQAEYIRHSSSWNELQELRKFNVSMDIINVKKHKSNFDDISERNHQGEWYHSIERGWHCSECDEVVKDMPTCMRKATYKFCPNCGARMEIENEMQENLP